MGALDLDILNDTSIRTLDHDIIFGYNSLLPEWGLKIFFEHVLPDDLEYVHGRFEKSYETNKLYFQCRIIRADKEIRWIEAYGNVYKDDEGVPIRILGVISDITERKETETQLLATVKEKELLLREIHHRVKNNMQIISSLLNLQSSQVFDKRDTDLFTVVQDRVKSMGLIHGNLYQSKDLSSINFNDYSNTLISELIATYAVNSNINLVTNIVDISLNIETAIPLGLIINELVTNSLKHAFPDSKGEISITVHVKGEELELIFKDNGVGLPEDFNIENPKKLGLILVNNLVEQIEGTIKLEQRHGTEFKIKFKELKYKERV
ncbi:sensor histidine kinase [Methanobacterium sp. SMA-27]|uniref:sensor histidine kinase n=1 Tax=Methanobacterium sp. SMA-27 TaxID=1495336 RepID=UPI0021018C3F|nr:histidine kinase dimerization/phosphoacceptor domain -containing protein [Methanobacterium sp. SMA-27]